MRPDPQSLCLTLPPARETAAPTPLPIVAAVLPVVAAVALWALTRSPATLALAALGPLGLLGARWEARRERRVARRRERERLLAALDEVEARVAAAHEAERRDPGGSGLVRLGRARLPSRVVLDGGYGPEVDEPVRARAEEIRERAALVDDAPLLLDPHAPPVLRTTPVLGRALARGVLLRWAEEPTGEVVELRAPASERWALELPHRVVLHEEPRVVLEPRDGPPVELAWSEDGTGAELLGPGTPAGGIFWPELVSRATAIAAARRIAAAAVPEGEPPERIGLAELPSSGEADARSELRAAIGADAAGPVTVDLVADGPHAIVAGTTGTGKSELLVAWVLALARDHPPDELSLLLVDFKGGSAFAPLAGLPHVVGVLSDLDAALARRAIESLRAELLRRERVLAAHDARGIDELPRAALARLVIVVDEAAALLSGQPELHDLVADLAARGRSLGLHLVLCTQRPTGVVRDAVLANVGLRLSLRVVDRADSTALLGDDSAARLPARPRGRAVLSADGAGRLVQLAISSPADVGAVRERWAGAPRAVRPWLDPLPAHLPRTALPEEAGEGVPFGLLDLPAAQAQPLARWDPARHGGLLVLGAAATGRTTALATLAAAHPDAIALPPDPADAWTVLRDATGRPGLLVADDLDALLARADPAGQQELVDLLALLVREGPRTGAAVAVSAARLSGPLASLAAALPARLLLRAASREELALAGGASAWHDPLAPPGRGRWLGEPVQVALPDGDAGVLLAGRTARPELPEVAVEGPLAVVTGRPALVAARLREAGLRCLRLGDADQEPVASRAADRVLVGDPEAWQAEWALLAEARRRLPVVVERVSPAELRGLLRPAGPIPPLGARGGECWLVADGEARRARWAFGEVL